ncbi:hypothetical protein [Sphingopyxis sp. Root1497]|uniref:hypothetical protein n=1 Tax=Sphingopyxis sp. Root1497 TaxID=1736474 RepID=UPI000B089E9D|nr:hypothetical protein [Sphingopyxis sp. Root1497]
MVDSGHCRNNAIDVGYLNSGTQNRRSRIGQNLKIRAATDVGECNERSGAIGLAENRLVI